MTIITLTVLIFLGALAAGLLGSMTGLGGGVIITPLLVLAMGVDLKYAIGASIVTSIATSSGAASAYVKEGITNIRIGMFLEVATTIGAIMGAVLAMYLATNVIAIVFGVILLTSAILSLQKKAEHIEPDGNKLAAFFKLNGEYPVNGQMVQYGVKNVVAGFFTMTGAGILSGLLGIGSGALKVLAMDNIMRIPFRVSTTTSNFMIGVTAAASAVIYFQRGYIDPGICFPVTLGVLIGSLTGARIFKKVKVSWLKILFAIIIAFMAIQMIYNGILKNI